MTVSTRYWLFVGVAVTLLVLQSPVLFASTWPHFGGTDQYTSYNPTEDLMSVATIPSLQQTWGIGCKTSGGGDETLTETGEIVCATPADVIEGAPAIYNGMVYVSQPRGLFAYDTQTGGQVWQFGSEGGLPPVVSEHGLVFYLQGFGEYALYALNAQNGALLWQSPLQFHLDVFKSTMVTVDEEHNLVYLVENDPFSGGMLYAFDTTTGNVVWSNGPETGDDRFSGSHVLLQDGKLFVAASVADTAETMVRIDATTQAIDRIFTRPQLDSSYSIAGYTLCQDTLFTTFKKIHHIPHESTLVAYNVNTSAILWQQDFSEITGAVACNPDINVIYVPTNPALYAFNAATGQELWKYTGDAAIYNPSVANGIIYMISGAQMIALAESTGVQLFSFPLGATGGATTQVAIADGMLYFSGNGGDCDLFAIGIDPEAVPTLTVDETLAQWIEQTAERVNPIPEPGTLLLVSVGLAGLLALARKKLKKRK